MTTPATEISSLVCAPMNEDQIFIPITVASIFGITVETKALIDSGANVSFIHKDFVKRNQLGIIPHEQIGLTNADGTHNVDGEINMTCCLKVTIGDKTHNVIFLVTNIGKHDIILGYQWLADWNPRIEWNLRMLDTDGFEGNIATMETEQELPVKWLSDTV